ncbi:MBL fold metallo-hydrolase [Echinicola sp. CAU 1574]|uniref:MBL fold metallo-hydrolase n=1 Tax=Echinicola arenosa TaxID=2774144 RepID=A0ABR9AJT3_9BACT|nr:MBL fold metallo-hydrolase [Echinicola arenosa]MBD8489053.1 MBL fold metallo-hydrolase [Echinicola arenosa]
MKTFKKQFGGSIRKKDLEKFASSNQWDGNKFVNLSLTTMGFSFKKLPEVLRDNFSKNIQRMPKQHLSILPIDTDQYSQSNKEARFSWFGHSVLLFHLNGKNILIDPMFGENASPIAPFKTKRFSKNTLEIIDQLPPIDAVLLTHDHYDHIDLESIQKLIPKVDNWLVALGVSRHLEKWGLEAEKIQEMDWWDTIDFEGIEITFTPSRHFSGRGATDRAKSLWGGFVFKTVAESIYHSGDGGYDHHFKEVGKKFGPFDVMFVECGQYYKHWHQIHLYPEESVQAAIDAKAKNAIPIHWGGFSLAPHSWKDGVERFTAAAEKKKLNIYTPSLGETFSLNTLLSNNFWWKDVK